MTTREQHVQGRLTSKRADLTAHEVELAALGAAAVLAESGAAAGRAVIVDVADPLEQLVVILAVAHLGATAVGHDGSVSCDEVRRTSGAVLAVRDIASGVHEVSAASALAQPASRGALDLERWVDLDTAAVFVSRAPGRSSRASGGRVFRRLAEIERRLVVPDSPGGVLVAADAFTEAGLATLLILANRHWQVWLADSQGSVPSASGRSPGLVVGTGARLATLHTPWPDVPVHDVDADKGDDATGLAPRREADGAARPWAEVGRLLRIVRDDPATYRLAIDRLNELSGLAGPAFSAGRVA